MRLFIIPIVVVCTFFISCVSKSKNISNIKKQWGYKWSYMDSTGHYQGVESPRNCFPGFKEINRDSQIISNMKIYIFNREGKLMYESSGINENWICNDHIDSSIKKGVYPYQIINYLPNHYDTITGTIIIY